MKSLIQVFSRIFIVNHSPDEDCQIIRIIYASKFIHDYNFLLQIKFGFVHLRISMYYVKQKKTETEN